MASIRKTKKVLKNSKGFLTIVSKEHWAFPIRESDYITSSKFCAVVNDSMTDIPYVAIPYKYIKRVYINR